MFKMSYYMKTSEILKFPSERKTCISPSEIWHY